ncbi:MAG: histidine--tRNA ligase [Planctomycetes bacterium]|nr:histidine--tRNA ligase [Planctomycetota bacterium]MCW8134592.1 histidine--tRNA ligase [Planctomycetota bacterium]
MARIEPRILKGFRDYLPEVMIPRTRLLRRIADVFERFGFDPLDTPSIEYAEILLGKAGPEAEKLFYRFEDQGGRDVALRYELTISLARVVAQYKGELPRPFKRYQMGPVWRAESPARGRFREFWQCDVDIVGTDSLLADAECLAVDHAVMRALNVPNYVIRFNNRKLFRGLQARIGVSDQGVMDAVMRAVDKFDKVGEKGVREELLQQVGNGGFTDAGLSLVFDFLKLAEGEYSNPQRIEQLAAFLKGSELGERGCAELREVYESALALGVPDEALRIDPTIVRGLDYYTGTVFETFLRDLPGFGSVMSGGRYDGLIGLFAGEEIPAVGISVGIDRLISALEELKLLPKGQSTAAVLVTIFAPETQGYSLRAASMLRRAGVPTELYLDTRAKLGKQLKYAAKRGFPLVVIAGPEEEKEGVVSLRNMASGEQMRIPASQLVQAVQDNYADPDGRAGRSWDWEFRDDMIDRVPQVGGVYLLRNAQHEVLKCGWAAYGKLPEAIRAGVTPEQREQVKTFDWYEVRDDRLSEMLAAFMIEKLAPKFD